MSQFAFRCQKRYSPRIVIDAEFETDRLITALFGPSGSGKTTILELIAGTRNADQGRITLGERTLVDTSRSIRLPPERRRVGLVHQDQCLFPHLTAEGNLRFGMRYAESARPITFDRVVRVFELTDHLAKRPSQLSGGERQRVALGRALLAGPELLLMDEPVAALDESLKLRVLAYLERAVNEWRIPTLFVSHSQAEVRRLAEWVVAIDAGKVVATGGVDDVLGRPAVLGWKEAAMPMNLLRVEEVQSRDGAWWGRVGTQSLRLPAPPETPRSAVFVEVAPGSVTIGRGAAAGTSARNHLSGQVRQVVTVADGAFVAVDVGQIVWSRVTAESIHELEIAVGASVVCHIKTHSLTIID